MASSTDLEVETDRSLGTAARHRSVDINEEQCRSCFDHYAEAVIVAVRASPPKTRYANEAAITLLGYPRNELLRMDPTDLFHEDDRARALDRAEALFAGQPQSLTTYRIVTQSGHERLVEALPQPIRYEGTSGLMTTFRDVTERSRQEAAHDETVARFQKLVENAPIGIYIIQDGRFVYTNPYMTEAYGYSAEELLAFESVTDLVVEEDRAKAAENVRRRAAGEVKRARYTMRQIAKDGRVMTVEINGGNTWYQERRAVIGTIQDITERVQSEVKIQQQNKLEAVGQLAAGIAHEINTPTQFVGDNLQFFKKACTDMGPVLEQLSALTPNASSEAVAGLCRAAAAADLEFISAEIPMAIQQSLDGIARVSAIVQAMKEFSHPGTGDKQAADLNHAIRTTLTVTRNEWKYVASVVEDLAADLPLVPCLAGEINQVLLNIIVNAAHAIAATESDDLGTITVRTRADDTHVQIRIEDTGVGIPKAIQGRIFEPFFTTKPVGKGTGQGLALAHRVLEAHDGTLDVESEVGRGTAIILRLPIRPDEASDEVQQRPRRSREPLRDTA